MKAFHIVLGYFALLLFSSSVMAREPVPVVNHVDVPVMTSSGKPVTAEQVRDAIVKGAERKGWEVSRTPDSESLSAKLIVRNKHTIVVSIPYSAERFSIKYQDSINMKYGPYLGRASYDPSNLPVGTPMIHPFYNDWVKELLMSINGELKSL